MTKWIVMRLGIVGATLIVLCLIFGNSSNTSAFAHDIYTDMHHPTQHWPCCGGKDCAPYPAEKVKEVKGGWQLEDGVFVPYGEAIPSPDGDYHRCDWAGAMRCFLVPANG